MKAFLFAAGIGQRLRPITEKLPKPLVEVGGKPLIGWHIEKLRDSGITELVINSHWLADQLMTYLGDGDKFGVRIQWSPEPELLGTGGGLCAALPLLGDRPFALISADVWSDFDYRWISSTSLGTDVARLVVVPNPEFHAPGDFSMDAQGRLQLRDSGPRNFTYSGIGIIDPAWVAGWNSVEPPFSWLDPLMQAIRCQVIGATLHNGQWTDVGTPERLDQLQQKLSHS